MKNELMLFENMEFGRVRVVDIDGEVWFVGRDIAVCLGYSKPENAIARHVDIEDTLKRGILDSNGKTQQTTCINESGMYSLILSSKIDSAKRFKRWVTNEVLPSIRKHGTYMTPSTLEQAISNPDFTIGLLQSLKEEQEARRLAESKVDEQKEVIDKISDELVIAKDNNFKFESETEVVKILKMNGISCLTTTILHQWFIEVKGWGEWEFVPTKGKTGRINKYFKANQKFIDDVVSKDYATRRITPSGRDKIEFSEAFVEGILKYYKDDLIELVKESGAIKYKKENKPF